MSAFSNADTKSSCFFTVIPPQPQALEHRISGIKHPVVVPPGAGRVKYC